METIIVLNNINILNLMAEHNGFGINTDIFETNILNLAVVIGVLLYYGKGTLNDVINNRRESIVRNLQEAEIKFKEAENNLLLAKKNLDSAITKAEQIRNQGSSLAQQSALALLEGIEEDIKRIKLSNLSTLKLEEEKAVNEIYQKLNTMAIDQAVEKILKKLNSGFQKKIIAQNIEKLSLNILTSK